LTGTFVLPIRRRNQYGGMKAADVKRLKGWSSTTTGSPMPRSLSPSPCLPIRDFRLGWVVRPSPAPALFLAAVQMRSF